MFNSCLTFILHCYIVYFTFVKYMFLCVYFEIRFLKELYTTRKVEVSC